MIYIYTIGMHIDTHVCALCCPNPIDRCWWYPHCTNHWSSWAIVGTERLGQWATPIKRVRNWLAIYDICVVWNHEILGFQILKQSHMVLFSLHDGSFCPFPLKKPVNWGFVLDIFTIGSAKNHCCLRLTTRIYLDINPMHLALAFSLSRFQMASFAPPILSIP